MAKERSQISSKDRWNVEALYPSFSSWQKDFDAHSRENQQPRWPELAASQGRLKESSTRLKDTFDVFFSIDRKLSTLYTYAHLRHDEEIVEDTNKVAYNKITSVLHDFQQEASWIDPELISLPEDTLKAYLSDPILTPYRFHIEKIIRIKPHVLAPEMEELLAFSDKALQASHKAFSAINDADFKFGNAIDSQGNEHEITHGLYGLYVRDQDRVLRKSAFLKTHQKYLDYENTLSELINGQIQAHLFKSKTRHYNSCLEAALFPKNIDTAVYHALIQAVHDNIGTLHKYVKLRQRVLGLDQLHLYDMYVPLIAQIDIKMPYEEAEELVIASVAPLGEEYQSLLKKGFKEQRWVDRYENKNKRSGAYSSGCYDSMPYILMNYKDLLRDVFTLAHEAGHSMHSLLSHTHQPYQYGDYPIFLAEVASTFNEDLLMRLMLKRAKSKEEKIFLLNQKIEDIRTTLFRQTMFAEFELFLHESAEKNIPLTPKLLKEKFRQLNSFYFGNDVIIDQQAEIEWARIPHFYYNFYVYQYATGISAAASLAEKVVNGGAAERDAYLSFLKKGCSQYPVDILQAAGVDMRSPEPVRSAIRKFDALISELDELI